MGQNKFLAVFLFALALWLGTGIIPSYGEVIVTFGPKQAKIFGSIPYAVIGKYKVQFSAFKGKIALDEQLHRIQSVYLEIEARSIKSNHPGYDKIVRSRRLLNTARYPRIIFNSYKIIQNESGYKVKGILEIHGIRKAITFPFNVKIITGQKSNRKLFDIQGSWVINRKDFNITWNKILDQGGILVGDDFTVKWGIRMDIISKKVGYSY